MAIKLRNRKGVKFVDRDRGWRRLGREIKKSLKKPHVVVGVYGARASTAHDNAPFTVGGLASVHEFGLGNNPERSFIRGTVDANVSGIRSMARKLSARVRDGLTDTRTALDLLGAYVHGRVIERINSGIPPANADSTIKRKGSSTPLIDKGQLKGSISWEVRNT